MSAIGLPMNGHAEPHFDSGGFCQCPCDQCTARAAKLCACLDCACDVPRDHEFRILRRMAMYGTCPDCWAPRDVMLIESGEQGPRLELACPACAKR